MSLIKGMGNEEIMDLQIEIEKDFY